MQSEAVNSALILRGGNGDSDSLNILVIVVPLQK